MIVVPFISIHFISFHFSWKVVLFISLSWQHRWQSVMIESVLYRNYWIFFNIFLFSIRQNSKFISWPCLLGLHLPLQSWFWSHSHDDYSLAIWVFFQFFQQFQNLYMKAFPLPGVLHLQDHFIQEVFLNPSILTRSPAIHLSSSQTSPSDHLLCIT